MASLYKVKCAVAETEINGGQPIEVAVFATRPDTAATTAIKHVRAEYGATVKGAEVFEVLLSGTAMAVDEVVTALTCCGQPTTAGIEGAAGIEGETGVVG